MHNYLGFSARIFRAECIDVLIEISRQCIESAQIFLGDLLIYKILCTGKMVFLQEKDGEYAESALFL